MSAAVPPKVQRKSKIGDVIEEARNLMNSAKDTLNEEIAKACEEGKAKWYRKLIYPSMNEKGGAKQLA